MQQQTNFLQQTLNPKVISLDAETNGLYGEAFMISAIAFDNGKKIDEFFGHCPIKGRVNMWVQEHVLPQIKGMPYTHNDYNSMLKDFIEWYKKYPQWTSWAEDRENTWQMLWHMGHIVETKLFRDAHEKGFLGTFEGPYVPIEVSTLLQTTGFLPDSVDYYIKYMGIDLLEDVDDLPGRTHNAKYDAIAAASVYFNVRDKLIKKG